MIKAGDRLSEWTLLYSCGSSRDQTSSFMCRCSCGAEHVVPRKRLLSGFSTRCRKCGFKKAGLTRTKPLGYSKLTFTCLTYKRHARERGYEWSLTREQVFAIVSQPCSYCGKEGGGIDRRDNSLGYTVSNSVACCGLCNRWKSNMTLCDFLEHAFAIANWSEAK